MLSKPVFFPCSPVSRSTVIQLPGPYSSVFQIPLCSPSLSSVRQLHSTHCPAAQTSAVPVPMQCHSKSLNFPGQHSPSCSSHRPQCRVSAQLRYQTPPPPVLQQAKILHKWISTQTVLFIQSMPHALVHRYTTSCSACGKIQCKSARWLQKIVFASPAIQVQLV